MAALSNSVFCSPDLGLIKFYLTQAVHKSSSKCLQNLDQTESKKLVADFIVPAVQQSIKDCSTLGNWKDEKTYVLLKIHGWFFMSWITGNNSSEMFLPIGTVFYLEVLRMCSFEKYLIQCLSNVSYETIEILIQDIARCSKLCEANDDKNLMLQLVEQCLSQLDCLDERFGPMLDSKLCHILTQIAKNVKQQHMQVNILSKLSDKLDTLLTQFKKAPSQNLRNVFSKKMNIIEFNERIENFMSKVELKNSPMSMKNSANNSTQKSVKEPAKDSSEEHIGAISCLVSCINQIITVESRSLFTWQSNDCGSEAIAGVKDVECRGVLFDIFTVCRSLQPLAVERDMPSCNELQLIDILEPYFQQHATLEENCYIEEISSALNESSDIVNEIGMINGTLEEKLQHALFQIDENLLGDGACFEWLLMTEELYTDERWLKCVMTHAKTFVSIKIVKMLLDVLSVLQEFDIMQGGVHSNIYSSLKKVILDLLPYLTLPEQREVVLYNFDLICLHFDSYQHQSFFFLPGDVTSQSLIKDILTATMNKLVNRSGQGFTKDVMNGIIQGCLVAPYLTLKELLTEASRHNGYEKVVCKLLQMMPWFVGLGHKDDDSLIIQVLLEIISSLSSKKQEGQCLKLIEALMQPYMHPDLGTKEPALVPGAQICTDLVIPLLTSEDDDVISPTLVLNILIKCLSCGLISIDHQPHWILDQEPLQLLFVLLEMYQDCERFWEDWVTVSREDSMDRNDVALDEAWTEMNVILKIVEEYLVPLLAEDISCEPARYYEYIPSMQDHLNVQDWTSSMLLTPLLQNDVFKECKIKLPIQIINLLSSQLNVEPIQAQGIPYNVERELKLLRCIINHDFRLSISESPFWTMYFKSGALSHEVCGMYLSKLKECHPYEKEANNNEGIVHALAELLPFSTWTQWQRVLNATLEMMNYKYLIISEEWKTDLIVLPDISDVDGNIMKTSELLVLILLDISNKDWATSYVWSTTLKNYVSKMKELSLEIGKENKFEVTCHFLAHLAYIAFNIVPEAFQENITIILLDIFNQCLLCISDEDMDQSLNYVQGIINMISRTELRLTMKSKMDKMFSNNVSK